MVLACVVQQAEKRLLPWFPRPRCEVVSICLSSAASLKSATLLVVVVVVLLRLLRQLWLCVCSCVQNHKGMVCWWRRCCLPCVMDSSHCLSLLVISRLQCVCLWCLHAPSCVPLCVSSSWLVGRCPLACPLPHHSCMLPEQWWHACL